MLRHKRQEIVQRARDLKGTPYCHRGFNDSSVDCYGLVFHVAKTCGFDPLPVLKYSPSYTGDFFADNFYKIFDAKGRFYREEGAIVALRQNRLPCHLGILTIKHGQWHMVHASLSDRQVVEHPIGPPFNYNALIFEAADFKEIASDKAGDTPVNETI